MSNRQLSSLEQRQKQRPKVIFFGMEGRFSSHSLLALLEQDIEVCAIVVPATPVPGRKVVPIQRREQVKSGRLALPLLRVTETPSIVQIAQDRQIPVWDVQRLSHETTVAILREYQADVICVACFSQRIPKVIRELPRFGCLNVHPSLLPMNRGPEPLFWTFREGLAVTGVTIHQLDEGMDTGDILAQETIVVPDGIGYEQLEAQCAQPGGNLLAKTVWNLYEGTATRTPQDEKNSSYHSFPNEEDFIVCAEEWDARHVYNFIRGVGRWDGPITLYAQEEEVQVQDVISYSHNAIELETCDEGEMIVQCRDGWVKVVMSV